MASDEEFDYMYGKFLTESVPKDGLVFNRAQERDREMYIHQMRDQRYEGNKKRFSPKREIEFERQEGLSQAFDSFNRGFGLPQEVGHKFGSTIGNTAQQEAEKHLESKLYQSQRAYQEVDVRQDIHSPHEIWSRPQKTEDAREGEEEVSDVAKTASSLNRLRLDKKLSGAAKRKLRKARLMQTDTGSQEQPGQHAQSTCRGTVTVKRTRTLGDILPSDIPHEKKLKGLTEPGVSCREIVTSHKMAIIPEKYPELRLTESDIEGILREILRRVDDTPKGVSPPLLRNYSLHDGALIYYCENEETCNWLKTNLNKFQLEENFVLNVVEAKDLLKLVKVAFRTRDTMTEDSRVLLRRLKRYNPALITERWKVIDRVVDAIGQRLILFVDQESARAIRNANFGAYTGLDRGIFKILADPNKAVKQEGSATERTTALVATETPGAEKQGASKSTITSSAMGTQEVDNPVTKRTVAFAAATETQVSKST